MKKKICCCNRRHIAKTCQVLFLLCAAMFGITHTYYWALGGPRYDLEPVEGWENNRSRDVRVYIQPENLTSILLPGKFCKNKTDLLVMITSASVNLNERNVIRETWGSTQNIHNFTLDFYFMLGEVTNDTLQEHLVQEFNEHNDIIQEQFLDTYNNLTLKSLMMLKLVKTHCINSTRYLMKTDDDMFVNVPVLAEYLKPRVASRELFGALIQNAPPVRQGSSKWKAPHYLYEKDVYPDYLSGTGYVMSLDVALQLYKTSLSTPIYYLEDVYITGILSAVAKLKPKHHPGFSYLKREADVCLYLTAVTAHHMDESEIRLLYDVIRKTYWKKKCKKKPQAKRQPRTSRRATEGTFRTVV